LTKLLEKSAQLWTQLLEDGSLIELQGGEEKLHTTMVDVKQQQKMISMLEKIKIVVEMKTLEAEGKAVQAQKMIRHPQLDPLQEKAEEFVIEIDETKLSVEHIAVERGYFLQKLVIAQLVEGMAKRSIHAQA
jgi:hypothetical protein